MATPAGTNAAAPRDPNVIYEGDAVICQTSDGRQFFEVVNKDQTIRVGKKLTPLRPVIGSHYGAVFEVQDKKLALVDGGLFPDPVAPETGDAFIPTNNNKNYTDTNTAQKMSPTELRELRENGVSGKEIIQKLVENSETWDAKTEFSKQKYLKKKQQKYMPRVRFLKCTAESLCRTYRLKNPSKICNMREDSLGQMLVYGNIFAGTQVLVVDTCMGLVTGAIAERQAGNGRIIAGFEGQQASADILRRFNFDKKTLESIHYFSFKDVSNLDKSEEDVVEVITQPRDGWTPEQRKQAEAERAAKFTEAERKKYEAKRLKRLETKIVRQPASVIRNWIRTKSDSLIIACHYDPETILLTLLPYLACSKPFVVYSEFLEPLTRTFRKLQQMESVIDLQLNETWTRDNQVLPGRTHPEMTMSACSGYLLSGIKIHEMAVDAEATANLEKQQQDEKETEDEVLEAPAKKQKVDGDA
ncbi:tRNA methyltransferase, partial [Globisporangium splendens]